MLKHRSLLLALAAAVVLGGCSAGEAPLAPVQETGDTQPTAWSMLPIEDLRSGLVEATVVQLLWTSPQYVGQNHRSPAYYDVRYRVLPEEGGPGELQWVVADIQPKQSGLPEQYYLQGLTPETTYEIWVHAHDLTGLQIASNRYELQTATVDPAPEEPKDPESSGQS